MKTHSKVAWVLPISRAMMQRGTKSKTYQQLQDTLTKLRAEVSMNSTVGLVQLRAKTKRENLGDVVDLIAEILKEPRFEPSELEVLRRQVLTGIEGSLTEPQALVPLSVSRKMSPYSKDDVRYVPSLEEELEIYRKVTIGEIEELHREFLGASVGEVSIVGDFDSDAIKQKLTAHLSNWKNKLPYTRIDKPAFTNIRAAWNGSTRRTKPMRCCIAASNLHWTTKTLCSLH